MFFGKALNPHTPHFTLSMLNVNVILLSVIFCIPDVLKCASSPSIHGDCECYIAKCAILYSRRSGICASSPCIHGDCGCYIVKCDILFVFQTFWSVPPAPVSIMIVDVILLSVIYCLYSRRSGVCLQPMYP